MDLTATETETSHLEESLWATEPRPSQDWVSLVMDEFQALFSTNAMMSLSILDRSTNRTMGFVIGGLLVPSFSRLLLTSKEPHVKAIARREILAGNPVVHPNLDLNPIPMAEESGREGLHLHFFAFSWRGNATGGDSMELRSRLGLAFYDRYAGMNLRLISFECIGKPWIEEGARNGLRPYNSFANIDATPGHVPIVLMGCDRREADTSGNPWLFNMFSPGPPRLPLRHFQRRILFYFRNNFTDEEIAAKTFRSPKSMKTTWDRIFEAIDLYDPRLLSGGARRRLLMEYLRLHPEEAWPSEPIPTFR